VALVVALLATFMDILDTTVVLVALPSIQRGLQAGPSTLQWTVAAYTLAFALLLINLPVGLLALAGASALLRESRATRPPRLDPVGALLFLASALLSFLQPAGPVQARGPVEAAPAEELPPAG
jgi:MFS family permease